MPAFNFHARFAPAVEAGTKRQTVRATRKRMPVAGETAHLYTGMRTKTCRLLGRAPITEVRSILVELDGTFVLAAPGRDAYRSGVELTTPEADAFARADGLANAADLVAWIRANHGLPFEGFVTYW